MDININLNLNKTTWTQEPKSEIVRMGSDIILGEKKGGGLGPFWAWFSFILNYSNLLMAQVLKECIFKKVN